AFNADARTGGPNNDGLLWQRSDFINPAAGITTVPAPSDVNSSDIVPEIGITGTPFIDANTLYVVDKTKDVRGGVAHYVQKLHALDITTGADRVAPFVIGDTTFGGPDGGYTDVTSISVPGTGDGSDGTTVRFNALRELQRPGLQIVNGIVYVAWASHGDNRPYHAWAGGFNPTPLRPVPGHGCNTTPH